MPFPNVATHRRMPHLHNAPRQQTPQQLPQEQQQQQQQQEQTFHNPTTVARLDQDSGSQLQLPAASSAHRLLEDSQASPSKEPLLVSSMPGAGVKAIQGSEAITRNQSTHEQSRGFQDVSVPSMHSRPTSPMGTLVPSGSTPTVSSHDSKMIKTALYDAFGCLYHPSAHTKHSLSSTAAALRSGDVTPLMGVSPKASPLLRPHMGPSAPITPLELSEELSSSGYFALHAPTSSTSPALAGTALGSSSVSTKHHRHIHTSSHLSATFTSEEQDEPSRGTRTPFSLSRRSSVDPMVLNPVEHPVLSSLQTLSITHPHPPEHYHPHLGHDLGHDRIPIGNLNADSSRKTISETTTIEPPTIASQPNVSTSEATTTTTGPKLDTSMPRSLTDHTGPPPSSPFPMDHGDRNSILNLGHQGLI
ncbi:hypothetical protein BGZ75_005415 [Mortierella antarctica]|nr:hypothetical protein BGZ75_005415 [Mortierella antarctica]